MIVERVAALRHRDRFINARSVGVAGLKRVRPIVFEQDIFPVISGMTMSRRCRPLAVERARAYRQGIGVGASEVATGARGPRRLGPVVYNYGLRARDRI